MKRLLFLFAALPLLLSSCSKDNDEIDHNRGNSETGNRGDIVFHIGIAPGGEELAYNASGKPQKQTRTVTGANFKTEFTEGDQVGIFAVRHAGGAAGLQEENNYIHNVKLTYSLEGGGTWTSSEPLYHAGGGYVLDFYAYYPYDGNEGSPQTLDPKKITFNVNADQSTATNYNASDLLYARTATAVSKGTSVEMTFRHALAMVQVEVDPAYIDRNGNFTTTLRGCRVGGTFNLSDGGLATAGDAQAVKMLRVESDPQANTYTYRALVPAQEVAQGTALGLMSQNGQLYSTPSLASALTLAAGNAKRYTAKLPATALATVKVLAGTFLMGSPDSDALAYDDEKPQHYVKLTQDFYMGKYQITRTQYAEFLNAVGVGSDRTHEVAGFGTRELFTQDEYGWTPQWNSATSKWEASGSQPMIQVSWYGAKAFADWVGGSLPTEAQWEYACRAKMQTAYSFGNDASSLADYGWYRANSSGIQGPSPVGMKLPNPWGLYDMHGNVWEWCRDSWDGNSKYPTAATEAAAVLDPVGTAGTYRVLRGGGWTDYAQFCRSAFRDYTLPDYANYLIGFRVVFVP